MKKKEKTEELVNRLDSINDLKCYSLSELETVLGITKRTMFNYIKDGKLNAFKIGGQWKVTESDLRKFIAGG